LASYLTKRNISATILADVKRFFHQINTDEVFGTHNCSEEAQEASDCGLWITATFWWERRAYRKCPTNNFPNDRWSSRHRRSF
jgi:hypothetical protein